MRRAVLAVACAVMWGCGGSGGSTAPAPAVSAPTISTSNTAVFIGQAVTFAATGTGPITWGGDAPSVATVDGPTGRITGVATGRVTIWADNAGGHTTRGLRVLPSYAGNWSGTYAITGCQSTGQVAQAGFCGNFFAGQVLNMGLNFSQADDRVSGGSYTLGGNGPGSFNAANVAENGSLPISGSWTSSTGSGIAIQNARLESATAGSMSGTFDQSWNIAGASGFGILSCSIRNVTRSSGGPTLLFRAPGGDALTFTEMVRRLHAE